MERTGQWQRPGPVGRRWWRRVAVGCLALIDALPLMVLATLVALAPTGTAWPGSWAAGTAADLLPVLALPTVVVAARCSRWLYRGQLAVAVAICAVVVTAEHAGAGPAAAPAVAVFGFGGVLVCAAVLVRRGRGALRAHLRELRRAGFTDPLTGALNRRGLVDRLPALQAAARSGDGRIGVAVVDLDHFKAINDTHGHAAGDAALREVCGRAAAAVGRTGVVVRSGGEELLLVTVGDAGPAAAALRNSLRGNPIDPAVTVSVGICEVDAHTGVDATVIWSAVARADRALYRAKAGGRDRIERAEPDDGVAVPRVVRGALEVAPAGASRPRGQLVGRGDRRLYQAIVAFMIAVGAAAAVVELLAASVPAARVLVTLGVGAGVGVIVICWLQRVRTSRGLVPVLVIASVVQVALLVAVPPGSRPVALVMTVLPGLLVAAHWPRVPLAAMMVLAAGGAVTASVAPGRPLAVTVLVAIATAAALVAALAVAGVERRHLGSLEAQLYRWAVTDPLTGLGNRRALQAAVSPWRSGYLLLVDVDGFKSVNDRFGHARGDAVLRGVGGALATAVTRSGSRTGAFRVGGDEFVVAGSGRAPAGLVERVHAAVRDAVAPVSVTVGVAGWSSGGAAAWSRALVAADRDLLAGKRLRARADGRRGVTGAAG